MAERLDCVPESHEPRAGIHRSYCRQPLAAAGFRASARAAGVKRIVAVAAEGETDPALAKLVDEIVWLNVGQVGKMISTFAAAGSSIA